MLVPCFFGGMSERPKEHSWKACVRESVPWVRIPLPPIFLIFPRIIFLLEGRVMSSVSFVSGNYGCSRTRAAISERLSCFVVTTDPSPEDLSKKMQDSLPPHFRVESPELDRSDGISVMSLWVPFRTDALSCGEEIKRALEPIVPSSSRVDIAFRYPDRETDLSLRYTVCFQNRSRDPQTGVFLHPESCKKIYRPFFERLFISDTSSDMTQGKKEAFKEIFPDLQPEDVRWVSFKVFDDLSSGGALKTRVTCVLSGIPDRVWRRFSNEEFFSSPLNLYRDYHEVCQAAFREYAASRVALLKGDYPVILEENTLLGSGLNSINVVLSKTEDRHE